MPIKIMKMLKIILLAALVLRFDANAAVPEAPKSLLLNESEQIDTARSNIVLGSYGPWDNLSESIFGKMEVRGSDIEWTVEGKNTCYAEWKPVIINSKITTEGLFIRPWRDPKGYVAITVELFKNSCGTYPKYIQFSFGRSGGTSVRIIIFDEERQLSGDLSMEKLPPPNLILDHDN
ncbi:hypothetical protein [Massilia sp. Root418]|uniref:hypothetical protein n=1 Tax=Massilia sp. Root418 TaxID=1736532 RepID=UPI0012F63F63|nr:hypothetical protein [Massilia sp. Root418]